MSRLPRRARQRLLQRPATFDRSGLHQPLPVKALIKFIVLGHARSGSSLLSHALSEHDSIKMYGELFHESEDDRRRYSKVGERFYWDGDDGAQFLRHVVFNRRRLAGETAIGFKIFYDHARKDSNARAVWDYLASDTDIRVIHLSRKNLLEVRVSLEIALRNKRWDQPIGTQKKDTEFEPVLIGKEKCEAFFNKILAYRRWAQDCFRRHLVLEVEYEEHLCKDFQATMNKVQSFLGVPCRPAQKLLEKQASRSSHEQIINYCELKEFFRDTPYEHFFRG